MIRTPVGTSQVLSTTCKWEIQNYSSISSLKRDNCIQSPQFYIQKKNWYLILFPNGTKTKESENYVGLFLYVNDNSESVEAKFSFYIVNSKKQLMASYHSPILDIFKNLGKGTSRFLKSALLKKIDNITIVCEIFTKDAVIAERIAMTPTYNEFLIPHAFKNYLDNAQFSDVTFIVDDKTIFAHKLVLAANSAVFAAMFSHEMRENKDSVVVIEDIKYEVFLELLRFMYTGGTCLLGGIAISELLQASDKYELLNLKHVCEIEISKNFSTNNVIMYLELADMYNAKYLRKKAIDFIVSHGQEMLDQPEFDSLRNLHADLFKDVFRNVLIHTNKKMKR